MLDQGQMNPNEFIYSGLGGGNHINLIDPTIYQIAGGTVRLVQSAVIGENVRMLTDVLGGVVDGAAVGVEVGVCDWLSTVHVCSAAGAAAVSATCVLRRACPGTLAGTRSAKRWPVARHNVTISCTKDVNGRLTTIDQIERLQRVREIAGP